MENIIHINLTKALATVLVGAFLLYGSFMFMEPTISVAQSDDDNVVVSLTIDSGITITSPADVTMSPNMGVSADSSIGSSTWNVRTNDPDGYELAVKATSSPALQGQGGQGDFADYTEGTPGTPDAWSVDASAFEFGFSAYGTDAEAEHANGGSSCGTAGTPDATLLYEGLTTSDELIATRAATTTTAGIDTTVCYAAEQNGVFAPAGSYEATIVATATVQ